MSKIIVEEKIIEFWKEGRELEKKIREGVKNGKKEKIMEKVKEVEEKKGIEIEIKEF